VTPIKDVKTVFLHLWCQWYVG